jgi:ATP synthase protein I
VALARDLRNLVALQLGLAGITSTLFFIQYGGFQAGSAGFGGLMAATNAGLLYWRRWRADTGRALSAAESLRVLYRSALERFVVIALLFALGLGVWRLAPLAVLAGFMAGQLALVFMGIKGKSASHGV